MPVVNMDPLSSRHTHTKISADGGYFPLLAAVPLDHRAD